MNIIPSVPIIAITGGAVYDMAHKSGKLALNPLFDIISFREYSFMLW